MKHYALSILALVLALAALFLSRREAPDTAVDAAALPAAPELAPLLARVEALEERASAAPRTLDTPAPERTAIAKESSDFEALEARIEAVEARLGAADTLAEKATRSELELLGLLVESDEEQLSPSEWQERANDPASTEEEKLDALRALRFLQLEDGSEARDYYVVQSMIDLVQTSEDPRVRADVYRQLSGVTEPTLLDPLLHSLAGDPSAEVRAEAAETLADYLPDARAESALRYALENDASERVREQAAESLF